MLDRGELKGVPRAVEARINCNVNVMAIHKHVARRSNCGVCARTVHPLGARLPACMHAYVHACEGVFDFVYTEGGW